MRFLKIVIAPFLLALILTCCQRDALKLYTDIKLHHLTKKRSLAKKDTIENLLFKIWDSVFLRKNDLTKTVVDIKDSKGRSPLHILAMRGHRGLIDFLIERGAELNIRNTDGQTPLAIASKAGHKETVDILLRAGATPTKELIEPWKDPELATPESGSFGS